MPRLSVRNVSKSFGQLQAVQNMSLDVAERAVTAVVGPNGAGKTTLFNCISGITRPDSASIRLNTARATIDLDRLDVEQICGAGVARTFQQVRLFDSLSVVDNVMLGTLHRERFGWPAVLFDRLLRGRTRHTRLRDQARGYLAEVGLDGQAERLAGELDHGNRRRVEIARALASNPLVLLLDEPAAGMNRIETDALMQLLAILCERGLAVLLIEHDMKLVMRASAAVYVMDHGELLTWGKPADVIADERVIEAYLGSAGRRHAAG